MVKTDVTVVIPHIPTRVGMLRRALNSVWAQDRQPDCVTVVTDLERTGSAATRNRGLAGVQTEWVAWLDDDDQLLRNHLRVLLEAATDDQHDVVYTGCTVVGPAGQEIPRQRDWGRFGLSFDGELLRQRSWLPVTSLVRTDLAQKSGGFSIPEGSTYDDWGFYLNLLDVGARFLHVPVISWVWNHHGANSSGRPDRW